MAQNKGKTKDQLDKLQDQKDSKITGLKVKLQGHKGPLIKLQGHKDPQRGLQEAKIAVVKEVKEDLKVKLPGYKGQFQGPKDLKLKVKLQDCNKSPKDHHKDPSNTNFSKAEKIFDTWLIVDAGCPNKFQMRSFS